MERRGVGRLSGTGSAGAAIPVYCGESTLEANPTSKESHVNFWEGTRKLHLAKRDVDRFDQSRRIAEFIKTHAEFELANARKTVEDLNTRIQQSNFKEKTIIRDLENLRDPQKAHEGEEEEEAVMAEVLRELDYVKREISKLRADMASISEQKSQAEKQIEYAGSQKQAYSSSVEALKREIEDVNEVQTLLELARIEAVKELEAIGAQRKEEAHHHFSLVENTKRKMNKLLQALDRKKEMEARLAVTNSAVNMLQNEVKTVKEMEKRVRRSESLRRRGSSSFRKGKELDSPLLVQKELEEAKRELTSIREEGYELMTSMDLIRDELKNVSEEATRLHRTEEKAAHKVETLSSKLLRAKAKLEILSGSLEKSESIVSDLTFSLQNTRAEVDAARKEKQLIFKETQVVRSEIERTGSEIQSAEERLRSAMQELEAAKSSESMALEKLQTLIESAVRARRTSFRSSTITISKFEYEYLTGSAARAEEIADKKIAAAQAWIEALKASQKEILMKTEMGCRRISEIRREEEQENVETEKREVRNWESQVKPEAEKWQIEVASPRKPRMRSGSSTPARRGRYRKNASPRTPYMTTSPGSVKLRRKMVLPNLAKFFRGKSTLKN